MRIFLPMPAAPLSPSLEQQFREAYPGLIARAAARAGGSALRAQEELEPLLISQLQAGDFHPGDAAWEERLLRQLPQADLLPGGPDLERLPAQAQELLRAFAETPGEAALERQGISRTAAVRQAGAALAALCGLPGTGPGPSLIAAYLTGLADSREAFELRTWVDQDPAHAEAFEQAYVCWEALQDRYAQPDPGEAWARITAAAGALPRSAPTAAAPVRRRRWMRGAALLLLAAAIPLAWLLTRPARRPLLPYWHGDDPGRAVWHSAEVPGLELRGAGIGYRSTLTDSLLHIRLLQGSASLELQDEHLTLLPGDSAVIFRPRGPIYKFPPR
ncbi:MAG: hypothetical protein NW241_08010 [Bacteroidia bacterium]|nr:hypothetical protein [Bacteroidia bacterium]